MRNRKTSFSAAMKVLTLLAAAFTVASCHQPKEPLRVVSSPWPGYEPLYLARDLGYIKEESVRLTEFPSSNVTMEAFSNRSADVATITLDETLTLLAEGRKVRILLVMDASNGGDAVMAGPDVKTLADLKGKRVAIVNIPLGVYMLTRTLETAGLKASDVTVVTLPEDRHEKAYREGKIDAAINFEPFKSHLEKAGMHAIFDSSKIPGEIFDLLVTQEDVYNNRRDELCQLVNNWFRTLDYVQANPDDAHKRMGKRLNMGVDDYRQMLGGLSVPSRQQNMQLLGGDAPTLVTPAKRLADIMYREHLLQKAVDPSLAIAPEFQNCVH